MVQNWAQCMALLGEFLGVKVGCWSLPLFDSAEIIYLIFALTSDVTQ